MGVRTGLLLGGALYGLAVMLILPGLGESARAATPPDLVVMAKQIDDIISLDPGESFEVSGQEVIGNIYERLLAYDPGAADGLTGRLAESWQVGEDGVTYTFKLRKGPRFESGNPVTAEDAAFSLRRAVLLDKSPAFILNQFGLTRENVAERIMASDPETLIIVTDKRYAPNLVYRCLSASVGSIVDRQTALAHEEGGDLGNHWLKQHSAGSGPYKLVAWQPNERYSLAVNEAYWGEMPAVRGILVRHVPDPSIQKLLLQQGDVDYARNLTRDELQGLPEDSGIVTQSGLKGGIVYLALNQKNPYLARPEIREALKYLVDYDGIAQHLLMPSFFIHQNFLPNGFLGASDARPYRYDPARARQLIAAAKLEKGFTLTLDAQGSAPWVDVAQALQASFAQAGIKIEIVSSDLKQIVTKYRARRHDMAMLLWEPDYLDPHTNAQAFTVNPDNGENAAMKTPAWRNAWQSPELAQLAETAALETDPQERALFYGRMQESFVRQSPFVIMFQQVEVAAHRANVDGFAIGPASDSDFYAGIVKH